MIKEAICSGKTVDEAIEAALLELNVSRDEASVEVLEMPSKKILGVFGGSDAKVKVTAEIKEEKKTFNRDRRNGKREETKTENETPVVEVDKGEALGTMCEEYLTKIVAGLGIENFTVTARKDESAIFVYIEGENLGPVIGKKGETLDALQHLANLVNRKDETTPQRVILDCGDYRAKRESYLTRTANSAIARAIKYNRCVALEPMNAYERRFVHTVVQNVEGVSSKSVGEDPYRKVIIEAEGAPEYVERRNNGRRDRRSNYRSDRRNENERPVYEHEKGQPIGRRDGYVPHTKRDVSLRTPSDSSFGSHASDGELFSLYEKIEPKFPPREENKSEE